MAVSTCRPSKRLSEPNSVDSTKGLKTGYTRVTPMTLSQHAASGQRLGWWKIRLEPCASPVTSVAHVRGD